MFCKKTWRQFNQFLGEAIECDDSFTELEDFGEISTIALPDDTNFVISNEEQTQENQKLEVDEDSCSKKDEDEMKLEWV